MNYCLDLPNSAVLLGRWLFDWQTLVGGLLALGAAYLAGRQIQRQIVQAETLHKEEVQRRHNAARSVLPLSLAGVSRFLQAMADSVASDIERKVSTAVSIGADTAGMLSSDQPRFPPINMPSDEIGGIRDFVETLSRDSDIRHVTEFVAQLQILHARYQTFDRTQSNYIDSWHILLLNIAVVRLLNDAMYNYARAVVSDQFGIVGQLSHDVVWDKALEKLTGLVFSRSSIAIFYDPARQTVDDFKAQGTSPWLKEFF